jgi:hypothetical protein
VLKFFTLFLEKLNRPLLHHVSIHQPIMVNLKSHEYCVGQSPSSVGEVMV